jgi:hypothetical protein
LPSPLSLFYKLGNTTFPCCRVEAVMPFFF